MSKPEVQNVFKVVNGTKRPTILMSGYVGKYSSVNSDDLRKAIAQYEKDGETDVDILINSGGGSTVEGLTIGDFLSLSSINFHGIVIGMAASMGAGILMFCDTRSAYKNSRIMLHKVKGGAFGESEALRSMADLIDQEESKIIDQVIQATGKTKADVEAWMKPGVDKWFNAKDALKEGLIQHIIEPKKPIEVDNSITDEAELLNAYEPQVAAHYTPNNLINTDNSIMKKAEIIAMLVAAGIADGLTENATDEQLTEALQNLVDQAGKATQYKTQLDGYLTTNGEALIGAAVKAGKIPANEKDQWLDDYKEKPEMVTRAISRMSGKPDPNNGLETPPRAEDEPKHELMKGREKWTFSEWQEKAPEDLETIQNEAPEVFDELFKTEYK